MKKTILFSVIIAFVFGCTDKVKKVDKLMVNIENALYEDKNYDEVISLTNDLIKIDSTKYSAYYYRSLANNALMNSEIKADSSLMNNDEFKLNYGELINTDLQMASRILEKLIFDEGDESLFRLYSDVIYFTAINYGGLLNDRLSEIELFDYLIEETNISEVDTMFYVTSLRGRGWAKGIYAESFDDDENYCLLIKEAMNDFNLANELVFEDYESVNNFRRMVKMCDEDGMYQP